MTWSQFWLQYLEISIAIAMWCKEGVKHSSIHDENVFPVIDSRFKQGTLIYQPANWTGRQNLSTRASRLAKVILRKYFLSIKKEKIVKKKILNLIGKDHVLPRNNQIVYHVLQSIVLKETHILNHVLPRNNQIAYRVLQSTVLKKRTFSSTLYLFFCFN